MLKIEGTNLDSRSLTGSNHIYRDLKVSVLYVNFGETQGLFRGTRPLRPQVPASKTQPALNL